MGRSTIAFRVCVANFMRARSSGRRTPPACWFRHSAETISESSSPQNAATSTLQACAPQNENLHARASSPGVACVFNRASFRLDLGQAGAVFYFHDLIAQERGAFELQIGGSLLHFLFKLAEQLGEIEVASGFLNDRGGDLAAAQDRVQTFLYRASHRLRCDTVLLVVLHLLGAAVFGDRHERFHALRHDVGEQNDYTIDVARGTARRLDERGLAAQEPFLVRIENADERNLGKVQTFTEQIDADENIEVGGAQTAQNLDALDRVDVAVQVAHL